MTRSPTHRNEETVDVKQSNGHPTRGRRAQKAVHSNERSIHVSALFNNGAGFLSSGLSDSMAVLNYAPLAVSYANFAVSQPSDIMLSLRCLSATPPPLQRLLTIAGIYNTERCSLCAFYGYLTGCDCLYKAVKMSLRRTVVAVGIRVVDGEVSSQTKIAQ